MRPIPLSLRKKIAALPFMGKCVYKSLHEPIWRALGVPPCACEGKVEWEHAFSYGKHQINEIWAIIPVCSCHHRGEGLNKRIHEWIALERADIDDLESRMPRFDWRQRRDYFRKHFGPIPPTSLFIN